MWGVVGPPGPTEPFRFALAWWVTAVSWVFGGRLVLLGEKNWSSVKAHMVDALAQTGEEGRGKLRKASGSCKRAEIRRYPNGETRQERSCHSLGRANPGN